MKQLLPQKCVHHLLYSNVEWLKYFAIQNKKKTISSVSWTSVSWRAAFYRQDHSFLIQNL